tara:strand:- start:593 stop:826 length:234 start_codon:yes stop_codon:yes gene_type:complete
MKFDVITEESVVYPGEYLLHVPSKQIVMCGAFRRQDNKIKVLARGRVMEDAIENFQKLQVDPAERKKMKRTCGGCKK